jgi:uracil-DNA glycosylase family 4
LKPNIFAKADVLVAVSMKNDMTLTDAFDSDLRACRKCAGILASVPVDPTASGRCVAPRPIAPGIAQKPILLIGQAPGIMEYETGEPFQGQAGHKIRDIFRSIGISNFDRDVYSSAVAKCFPGRKLRKIGQPERGCEDRVPSAEMVRNCRPFLERELALVNPQVIVTLGSFSLKTYTSMAGLANAKPTLERFVGKRHEWNGRSVIFFPHTSGGARWLNDPDNRILFSIARAALRETLISRGIISA